MKENRENFSWIFFFFFPEVAQEFLYGRKIGGHCKAFARSCKICEFGAYSQPSLFSVCDFHCQVLYVLLLLLFSIKFISWAFPCLSPKQAHSRLLLTGLMFCLARGFPNQSFPICSSKINQPPHCCDCPCFCFTEIRLVMKCILFLLLAPKKSVTLC